MENETGQLSDKERIKLLEERVAELEAELETERRRYGMLLSNMQNRISSVAHQVRSRMFMQL